MRRTAATLFLLALPALAAGDGTPRRFARNVLLDGATRYRPAIAFRHEMTAPAREVVLHLRFARGLCDRRTKGDSARAPRPATAGLLLEYNDAARPTHPRTNPFRPLRLAKRTNPHWTDTVEPTVSKPAPGRWFTTACRQDAFDRPLRVRFERAGRYRLRVAGLFADRPDAPRAPTLIAITEAPAGARDGLDDDAPPPEKEQE